jgi:transposase
MNEEVKYELIKNLVEKKGNKRVVSIKLNCSLRTIDRLINKFKTKGKKGFVHGNRDSKPSNAMDKNTKETIIATYKENNYNTANFKHFCQLLFENKGIKVSYSFIHNLLSKTGIYSPKCQRITKRKKVKAEKIEKEQQKMLANQEEKNQDTQQTIETTNEVLITPTRKIPNSLAHPRKERKKYFGEQIQMDASDHL